MVKIPEIIIKNITKRYGDILALDNVSLRINDGEYVCVIGPSGSGKSTLLKIIAGIIEPTEGKVLIDGIDISTVPFDERGIGVVLQDILLFPNMNVRDNVSYPPLVRGLEYETVKGITSEVIKNINLTLLAERFPDELSRGSQQKTAIARAVASGARLILMDEPMGSLDTKSARQLRYELRSLIKDLGLTAIHVTHNQEEAMSVADRIIILRRGKIIQEGSPREIYFNPHNLFIARFIGGELNAFEGEVIEKNGKDVKVEVESLGIIDAKAIDDVDKGERVGVAIRPEDIIIKESSKKENIGVVEHYRYYGFFYEVFLKLGEKVLYIKVPRKRWFYPTIGGRFNIDIIRAYVFKYPEEGLERALAYE